jgi:uncharacterized membrane protein YdjX (TVP38/TMEM64 family)
MNEERKTVNAKVAQKVVIVAVIVVLVVVFYYFDLGRYFTLSYLKESQAAFAELYAQNVVLVLGTYMVLYIIATALSLPGAAALTIGGGALFGLMVGTVIVSFASTIGATLACFFARFLFRDWVQNKFGNKLEMINRGIDEEGTFYLFTLRLIPVFPFFMINLVMGLTKMPLLTFYWVSQVGMLAGTIVYVNAGKELAKIDSLAGIMSPSLIISFVILGIFPLTVKKLMGWYREKKGKPRTISE